MQKCGKAVTGSRVFAPQERQVRRKLSGRPIFKELARVAVVARPANAGGGKHISTDKQNLPSGDGAEPSTIYTSPRHPNS